MKTRLCGVGRMTWFRQNTYMTIENEGGTSLKPVDLWDDNGYLLKIKKEQTIMGKCVMKQNSRRADLYWPQHKNRSVRNCICRHGGPSNFGRYGAPVPWNKLGSLSFKCQAPSYFSGPDHFDLISNYYNCI